MAAEDGEAMAWYLERMTVAGIGLALVLILATGVVAYRSTDDLVATTSLALHAQAVLSAADQVIGDLSAAESGQRGYLITGDPRYLEPYDTALRDYPARIDGLRALASGNPAQQDRVEELATLGSARLADATNAVELRRTGNVADAIRAVSTGQGRDLMDQARRAAGVLQIEEQRLLLARSEEIQEHARMSTVSIIGGSGMAFILVTLSTLVVLREGAINRRLNRALARARDELEQRVAERTAELVQANEALQVEMSERALAREQLELANLQLERALHDVGQAQAAMLRQERLRALGELASGIVHDFNNALSMIIGFAELILAEPESTDQLAEVRGRVQLIHSAATGAAAVVARLRDFYRSRFEGEDFQPVELNAVIAQATSLTQPRWRMQAQAAGRAIQLQTDLAQIPPVDGRESDLREALTNLLLNAVDAMPRGGTLTVRSRLVGAEVVIEVSDTGIGMPAEVRSRVFEPFFTTKGEAGTGLGLSLVHSIVERHHGEIHVASAEGQGTTFTLRLPVARGERSAAPAGPEAARVRGLRVLLAEDGPALRQILVSYLKIDDHAVTAAADGVEAIQALHAGTFDLVITDRAMPNLDGDQLAAEVKRLVPSMPVLMLTGLGDLMQEPDEHPAGVDVVVGKPIGLAGLRAALAEAVQHPSPQRNDPGA
jgi:signal transduction histidine kinase/ActR/RegA family two-component response regulator